MNTKNTPLPPRLHPTPENRNSLLPLILALVAIVLILAITVVLLIQSLPKNPDREPTTMPTVTDRIEVLHDEIKSQYAILIDADTGEILAGKNHDVRFSPASMTKVMTLIVACERLREVDLDRKLQLTSEAHDYMTTGAYAGASTSFIDQTMYLNDYVSIKDALYAIGVASAADATYLICVDIAGSEAAFVDLMNQKAAAMGLTNTHFDNAIGHESENNYTTASDMAAIMAYALQSDMIREILSCNKTYACKVYMDAAGTLYPENYHWYINSSLFNTNPEASSRFKAYESRYKTKFALLGATFCGGKTGTLGDGSSSDPWVYSLVSFAVKDGKTYIAVTGETQIAEFVLRDAKELYDNYIK